MLITTSHGLVDEALLVRRDTTFENDHEYTTAVEFWRPVEVPCDAIGDEHRIHSMIAVGDAAPALYECVHRSPHVTIKEGLGIEAAMGEFQ